MFLTLSFTTAFAGNIWDGGGGDNLWGTGANWNDNTSPGTGTTQDLNFAGTTRLTPQNNYGNWDDFRSIFFNSGAGAFTINGNPVDLWVASGSGKIENNSSNTQTINFDSFSINGGNYEMNPVSGNLSVTSNNIFTNGNQIHVWGDKTLSFGASTVISQGGGLVILGGGTVIFQSAHTFTGQSYINSGTLRINPGGSANSSTLNLGDTFGSSNATLLLGGNNMSLSSAVNVRSGNTGSMTINASGSNLTLSGGITLNKNAAITAGAGNDLTISGAINTNSNTLDKLGAGNLTLTSTSNDANNRYYLGAGTLNVSAQTNLGNRATFGNKLYFDGGILNVSASFTIQGNNGITFAGSGGRISVASGQTLTIQSYIDDINATNDFIKSGTGTLFLDKTDTNDFSHTTIRVYEGTLSTWNPGGLLSSTVQLGDTATSGTYQFTKSDGAATANKTFTIAAGGGSINVTNDALSLGTGNLTGAGTFTKLGDGTLTVSGASNSHSGAVVVSAGSLALTSAISSSGFTLSGGNLSTSATNQLANTATLTVNTGTFTLGGADTVGAISGSGGTINLGANALTTDTASSSSYSGTITGTGGSLTKNGTGTLTLSGANTFSGGVTLNAGQLNINTATAIGNGTLAINGGTIDNTSAAAITLSNNNAQSWNGNFTFAGTRDLNMGTGTITLGANRTVTVASGNLTLAAPTFSGGYFITKDGGGTLDIGNVSRTWASGGGFFINSGTLAMTAGNNLGTNPNANQLIFTGNSTLRVRDFASIAAGRGILINSGVTATIDASVAGAPFRFESVISGAGSLNKIGVGTALLDAANTYTGTTTISSGILQIGNAGTTGALSTSSTITNNAALVFNRSNNVTQGTDFANNIGGSGTLTQNGSGTLFLNTANSYTGATTINTGIIRASNATALGTTAGGVTVASGAALELSGDISIGAEILSLTGTGISSGGALRNTSGTNSLAGAITLAGATRINSDAGTLTLSGGISGTHNLTIGGAGATTVSSAIATSTGTLTKDGAGTLTLSGANTYTGLTTISAGNITLSGGSAIVDTGTISLANTAGVQLNINSSETVGAVTGGGTTGGNVSVAASQTLTVSANNNNSFAGIISGSGGLTKNGTGTYTLSGANSYTGATTINAGTLALGANNVIGDSSAVTVSGGTLEVVARTETLHSLNLTGGLVTLGTGTLTLNNASSITGGEFRITAQSGGGLTTTGLLTLGSASMNYTASSSSDETGALILGGNIAVNSSTTFDFLDNGASAGDPRINLNDANRVFDVGSGANLNVGWVLSSSTQSAGSMTKNGSGTMTLNRTNLYTGGTTINDGTLVLGHSTDTLTGGAVIINGGTLSIGSNSDTVGTVTLAGGNITGSTGVLTGSGTYALQSGAASAILGGAISANKTTSGTVTLSGANTFTNGLRLSEGQINLNSAAAPGSGTFTIGSNGVTFDNTSGGAITLSNNNAQAWNGNFTFAGTHDLNMGTGGVSMNASRVVTVTAGNLTIGGVIAGASRAITKEGAGTLILGGANTHSGATTINAGSLVLNGSNTASAITINSGTLAGTGSGGATTVAAGGRISPGGSSVGTLATTTLTLNGTGGYIFSIDNVAGSAGTNWDLINVGSGSGAVAINSTSGSRFTIFINGTPTGWSNTGTYAWDIISSSNVTGFAADKFDFNLSGFNGGSAPSGSFFMTNSGSALVLNYAILGDAIWSGGTANWDTGFSPPVTTNANVFFTGAGGGTATNNIPSATLSSIQSITFNSTAGAYTLAADFGSAGHSATPLTVTGSIVNNSSSNQTVNLALSFASTRVVDTASGNISIGGVINGDGGLTKNGTSTLTLTQSNTLTGAIQINEGTLATTGSGGFANTANITVASGATYNVGVSDQINTLTSPGSLVLSSGTLTISSSANSNISGAISGSGNLTKAGSGTLTISNNNSGYSGETRLEGGVLEIGNNGALGTGTITFREANSTLRSTDATDRTLSNAIGTFTGGNGTVYTFGSVGTGNLTFSGTGSTSLGSTTITRVINVLNNTTSFGQSFSGSTASITKTGSGTLVLTGNSTYGGATTISAGTLQIGAGGATGSIASPSIVNNSALLVDRTGTLTLSGNMSGSGTLTKNGSGTLVLSGSNSYNGATTLNLGTLTLQSSNALGTSTLTQASAASLLTIATTGTLSNTMSLYNVAATESATLGGTITVNNATFDVESGDTLELSGGVGGSGGVTKEGAGTLLLSGSNNYSGATVVNAGVLNAANANALGTNAAVTVNGGSLLVSADDAINSKSLTLDKAIVGDATAAQASLAFGGAYSNTSGTAGSLTLDQNSIIDLGTGGVVVHFASIANLNSYILHIFNWEGDTVWSGSPGGGKDQFYVHQNLGTTALGNIRFYSGTTQSSFLSTGFQIIGGSFNQEIIAVPEPETWATAALLLSGAAWGMFRRPRMRQRIFYFGTLMPKRMKTLPPRSLSWGWGAAVVLFERLGENGRRGNMVSPITASIGDGGATVCFISRTWWTARALATPAMRHHRQPPRLDKQQHFLLAMEKLERPVCQLLPKESTPS